MVYFSFYVSNDSPFSVFFVIIGYSTAGPTATDLSNAQPVASVVPSYQDFKPAGAWNDPPTVVMKTAKPNAVKVNSISLILSNHLFSNNFLKPPGPSLDGFNANTSPFLPVANELPQSTFHFNPTTTSSAVPVFPPKITTQATASIFPSMPTSDFVHNPVPSSQEPTARNVVTPPPPPAPVVKGPLPTEHQVIQDTFDLLVNRCQQATQQLPLKRKLDEVKKKLDVLYDKLRENRVKYLFLI